MTNCDRDLSDSPADVGTDIHPLLSPATIPYIRKLLRQNLDRLQFDNRYPVCPQPHPLGHPNAIATALYPNAVARTPIVAELEQLVATHRDLSYQPANYFKQIAAVEQQIFHLLGFQLNPLQGQKTVLIVDDTPENLRLLSSTLSQQGYEVCSAISGAIALNVVQRILPDLILLDIRMPGMSGYDVCKQLKANPLTQDIPVLFLSAIDNVIDKVQAFKFGGVDYITKPFQIEEVLVRVAHHLQIHSLRKRLEEQNVRLQQESYDRRQAEEHYRSIIENSVDGIFQIAPDGHYLSANLALARILGYESPEALMLKVRDVGRQLYVQPQRRAEIIAYMRRYDTVSDFESQVYRQDGDIIWISEDVRTVKDMDGNLLYYEGTVKDITERKCMEDELRHERQKTERLLFNVLPQSIAERLKRGKSTIADHFTNVTVLFADIVNFTTFSAQVTPYQLVSNLNQIFSAFDYLVEQYGLEKIKTYGDAYMAVGGLPTPRPDHAHAIAELALAMQETIQDFQDHTGEPFSLRIGINTGPVVAGVIGTKKFSYDLWGDTVNIASRMESEGIPGKIQVTDSTHTALQSKYLLEPRGTISIKGRGSMMTYWLTSRK